MRRRRGPLRPPALLLAALTVTALLSAVACSPRGIRVAPVGRAVDPAPLVERLARYNQGPRAVRAQGRIRSEGRGSARFGARVTGDEESRIDLLAGPFGTPLLALWCRPGAGCLAYLPREGRAYAAEGSGWPEWLAALLRGRIPELGHPVGARVVPRGAEILEFAADPGWRAEVEFAPGDEVPDRAVLFRWGAPRVQVVLADPFVVDGQPFPQRIRVDTVDPPGGYELEFERVEAEESRATVDLSIVLPPGTAVERVRGWTTWNEMGLPLWLPTPAGRSGARKVETPTG